MPKIKFKKEFLHTPKGTRDILPHDVLYWQAVESKAAEIASAYGFYPIRTPHIEKIEIFTATLGKDSDVVEKQMYAFRTRGGDQLVLRPEGTASIMRAYFEHGMHTWPQPVMLYYYGSFFRHESPQRGRYREFGQFGAEIIGEESSIADALIIRLFLLIFQDLGFKSCIVHVNTLGDKECRSEYRKELVAYYRRKINSLCKDCKRRIKINPLRLLDCKNPACVELKSEAPQMMNYACSSCKVHFKSVLEFLDCFEIPYYLDPYLVRGLDYYSRTVFEIFVDPVRDSKKPDTVSKDSAEIQEEKNTEEKNTEEKNTEEKNTEEKNTEEKNTEEKNTEEKNTEEPPLAIASGGRYDYLAETLGKKDVVGVGGAIGIDRLVEELKKRRIKPFREKPASVFLIQLGPQAKRKSIILFEQFRKAKLPVAQSFSKDSLRSQLELADKIGVKLALIIGQKEALDDTVIVRDMASGAQESVFQSKILDHLKKKLSTKGGFSYGVKATPEQNKFATEKEG